MWYPRRRLQEDDETDAWALRVSECEEGRWKRERAQADAGPGGVLAEVKGERRVGWARSE